MIMHLYDIEEHQVAFIHGSALNQQVIKCDFRAFPFLFSIFRHLPVRPA